MAKTKILIAGEGGQGIQTIAKILAEACWRAEKKVTFLPNFGVEQRGGVSLAFVQVADGGEIDFPKFEKADIAVVLVKRALKRIEGYLGKDTILIFDNSLLSENDVSNFRVEKIAIPAAHLAKEKLIPRVFNIIILGALAAEVGIKRKYFNEAMAEYFQEKIKKEPQLRHFNQRAFEIGEGIARDLSRRK